MDNQSLSNTAVLEANGISKEVSSPEGHLTILSEVSFVISKGESVAVVGPSGAGKSTLLALLAGLDLPTKGHVELNGHNLGELDEDGRARIRAESVGFVFQSFQLLPTFTALENVMLPLEILGNHDAKSIAMDVLNRVGLENRIHHYPNQLSGGEQQRVAIARAFAPKPSILLADEPTGNLDSKTGQRIIDLLFELNQEHGATLILVTHDTKLAARCERAVHLEDGRLEKLS